MPTTRIERPDLAQRIILDNVKIDDETHCWIWTYSKDKDGYGLINFNKKLTKAHRLSYMAFKGEITKPMICHSCDNPSCVNPEHLFPGTAKDNAKDMSKKKRGAFDKYPDVFVKRGKDHKDTILTEDNVRFIRENYIPYNRKFSFAALGKMFGVSGDTARQAFFGKKAWKYVE